VGSEPIAEVRQILLPRTSGSCWSHTGGMLSYILVGVTGRIIMEKLQLEVGTTVALCEVLQHVAQC